MDQPSSGGQKGRPNRNRQRSRNGQNRSSGSSNKPKSRQNQSSGNRNRNNRRRNGPGGKRSSGGRKISAKKPSLGSRILSVLTFGLLGSSKSAPPKKSPSRKQQAQTTLAPAPPKKRSRKNAVKAVTGNRLHIQNLDYAATESDLNELFRGVGTVVSAEVATNSKTQQSKGYAYVEMSHIDEARRAFDILHDEDFMGRKLSISDAVDEEPPSGNEERLNVAGSPRSDPAKGDSSPGSGSAAA